MASGTWETVTEDATYATIGLQIRSNHDVDSTAQDHKSEDRIVEPTSCGLDETFLDVIHLILYIELYFIQEAPKYKKKNRRFMASATWQTVTKDATNAKIGFLIRGKHDIHSSVQNHKCEDRF